MHLIDIAGAIAAHRHTRSLLVTAAVDGLQFLHPIKIGDLIILRATVTATFHTSLEVEVEVFSEGTLTGDRKMTSRAFLTFVAIDRDGKRVPDSAAAARDRGRSARVAREAEGRRAARLDREAANSGSASPQPDPLDRVIRALFQHEPRALARRLDVLAQVDAVDRPPDVARGLARLRRRRAPRSDESTSADPGRPSRAARGSARCTTTRCATRRRRCRSRSRRSPTRRAARAGPAAGRSSAAR